MNEPDIYIEAIERKDPADRQRFLDEACKGNPELRERVEKLLRQSDQIGSFLEHPPLEAGTAEANSPAQPEGKIDPTLMYLTSEETETSERTEFSLDFLQPSENAESLGRMAHYEILGVIGQGAFGTVLRGFDQKLQRVVAIKVLSPELAATSPPRKRFLREARSSAQVRHENVVGIYAVEDDPTPYLVMEYIPGKTLQARLDENGPLPLTEVLRIGKQIASGLAAAHSQNLIHRDIKPGNILLEEGVEDHVKITDFGLARTVDDASMTQTGVIAGTPLYMAPEQIQGGTLDSRTDLFSLGSVLYQMLTGRPPFRASTTMGVLKRVAEDCPRAIREIIPETPEWMCEIVRCLHAKDPNDRFDSALHVSEILAQCLADLDADRTPQIPSPTSWKSKVSQGSDEPQPRSKWRSLSGAIKVTALVLLLVVVGLGLRNWYGSGAGEEIPRQPSEKTPIDEGVALQQVEFVRKELKRLNPEFDDSTLKYKIENGIVVELTFLSDYVSNISPVAILTGLQSLSCEGTSTAPPYGQYESAKLSPLSDLSPLKGLPLESLACGATEVSDLEPLRGMPLEHFRCAHSPVSDLSALDPKRLKTLWVGKTKVTDESLAHFEGCTNLRTLMVAVTDVTNEGIGYFRKCRDIEKLSLAGTGITDEGLGLFKGCTGLKSLKVNWTKVSNKGLENFSNCENLTSLVVGHSNVDHYGLAPFADRKLTELDLEKTGVTDEALKLYFKSCDNLRTLNLASGNFTNDGLAIFAGCKNLEELILYGNPKIGDAGLAHFAGCTKLKGVHLERTGVTDAGMVHLKDCRQLEWLSLNSTRVGGLGLAALRNCTNLAYLNLTVNFAINDAGMVHLANFKNLNELHL
ncbi:MAG: protein kinase, partial [Planctomycetaceae bacterium]|nr:protein kinase [Planctomycetaceae bacterium]